MKKVYLWKDITSWHSLRNKLKTRYMRDKKTLNKLTKKDFLKILIFVLTFLIAQNIFSNWEDFKAGLFGF